MLTSIFKKKNTMNRQTRKMIKTVNMYVNRAKRKGNNMLTFEKFQYMDPRVDFDGLLNHFKDLGFVITDEMCYLGDANFTQFTFTIKWENNY